jgi:RNA polymerase sigma-70 factor (ECF subfamily)
MEAYQDLSARFLETHLAHQKMLLGYFLASVKDFQLAEDLLQKTTLILWENYKEGGEPASYMAWAFGIARRVVARHFRDTRRREVALPLEILDRVASQAETESDTLTSESKALAGCIKKLPGDLKELVRRRYEEGESLGTVAAALGQSLAAVNMKLVRLRRALLECSRQALSGEEA